LGALPYGRFLEGNRRRDTNLSARIFLFRPGQHINKGVRTGCLCRNSKRHTIVLIFFRRETVYAAKPAKKQQIYFDSPEATRKSYTIKQNKPITATGFLAICVFIGYPTKFLVSQLNCFCKPVLHLLKEVYNHN
jgi:hypothetical protein